MDQNQLAQLKAKTRCLRCKRFGYWPHECPDRVPSPSKNFMLLLVQELGNDEVAVAKRLWAVSEDDDEYHAYIASAEVNTLPMTSPLITVPRLLLILFKILVPTARKILFRILEMVWM